MEDFKPLILSFLLIFVSSAIQSQHTYKIDVSDVMRQPLQGYFKMGNPGPSDKAIQVNSLYLTIGGKPVIPVMGEIHFSRIRKDRWEDCLLKMKACGVNIISTYLFWNQHEEIEGRYDWENEKDIRAFVTLCAMHNLYAIVRLGPWSHGEARNGGTPDWILRKKYIKDRSNDVVYQQYVKRYFGEIASQLKGLYYKDGGPVIGIQLENEYWYGKEGEAHIQWLKNTALGVGIDVPLYTVTGWGNGSVPPFEVIPLWGAYADAPWAQHIEKEYQPWNFHFDSFRDNKKIGNDQIASDGEYMSYDKYPYFTCEVGIGVQNTYHRRPVINAIDGRGMMTAKLGSGSNLLGYYIFTGATQFRGQLHSTEEEQEETGYWTRVPLKSYDFQAAIRESGEISEAYKEVKKLHYFIGEAGQLLAPMLPVIYGGDKDDLQLSVRSDNFSGFLFGINYARYENKPVRKACRFEIKLADEIIAFPQQAIDIPDSAIFIWPINYRMEDVLIKYATVQLLGHLDNTWLFFQNRDIIPEIAFDLNSFEAIKAENANIARKDGMAVVTGLHPGKSCILTFTLKSGNTLKMLILNEEEANNCYFLDCNGKKECYISENGMYADNRHIYMYGDSRAIKVSQLTNDNNLIFKEIIQDMPAFSQQGMELKPRSLFTGATWLETGNFKEIPAWQQRYHRFFIKEFSLDNPSRFRNATLFIYPESECQVNLNNTWIRQGLKAGSLNAIDLTGYVTRGENILMIDFPYTTGLKRFAARMEVDYYNYDKFSILTDRSWLALDSYTNPVPLKKGEIPSEPVVVATPEFVTNINSDTFREWDISVPFENPESGCSVYIKLKYKGDRAELYNGTMLSADNFNDNRIWSINLRGQEQNTGGKNLRLILYRLSQNSRIFFDILPAADAFGVPEVSDFKIVPEYKIILK